SWFTILHFCIDTITSLILSSLRQYYHKLEIELKIYPLCIFLGSFVYTHCTRTDIIVCVQCPNSTFTDKPHGRHICNPCTACNEDSGLKTVKECKPSSDAVCGALEGNYCTDPYEGGCRAAQKHTTCKPGHFIKHPGTHSNDTVCENCPENSFSDGSSTFCTPHTNCKANRLPTVKAGDSVSDAECGERSQIPVIVAIIALVCYLVVIIREIYKCKYQKTASPPNVLFRLV
uniref:TNFR-Cys domain-containing protein n=1 Tax=Scleropages formosus TaxID=113540 RepID=A0A8C9TF33_SCLFO